MTVMSSHRLDNDHRAEHLLHSIPKSTLALMKPTILFPSGPALSWEILDRFLSYLPLSDLAEASVLNHTWQTAVFPHLYHTLRIGYAERLEQIARRAASDDGRGPLSISAHVKGLVLRQAYSNYKLKSITQDHLNHLKLLIPRLKKLQSLSWELYLLADDMEIMPMFQTHCPNLKSFHVNIDQDNFFYHTGEWYFQRWFTGDFIFAS